MAAHNESDSWYRKGVSLRTSGAYVEAAEAFTHALEGKPSHRNALFYRAVCLKEAGQTEAALSAYRSLLDYYPDDAAGWRMYGVSLKALSRFKPAIDAFRRSLSIVDDIPTRNALVIALATAGETDAALIEGLKNLEAKDAAALRTFNDSPFPALKINPLRRIFNPRANGRNIIAFSLWGDNPVYVQGAIINAQIAPHFYYGWTARFYCDRSVPADALDTLRRLGAQVLLIDDPALQPLRPLWRFLASDDPNVDFFICRDTDSRLNGQELNAVDAWLHSGKPFHAMRDHVYHMELMLAGMWGGMAGVLPGIMKMIFSQPRYRNNRFGDQAFLMDIIWPLVRDDILVHDSCYRFHGSEEFPPGYRLPRPIHVGGAIKNIAI